MALESSGLKGTSATLAGGYGDNAGTGGIAAGLWMHQRYSPLVGLALGIGGVTSAGNNGFIGAGIHVGRVVFGQAMVAQVKPADAESGMGFSGGLGVELGISEGWALSSHLMVARPFSGEGTQVLWTVGPTVRLQRPEDLLHDEHGDEGSGARRTWIGLALSQDFLMFSGDDVCGQASQADGAFSCFRADGRQYHGNPIPGAGNAVGAGFVSSTRAFLASLDYALGKVSVGGRFGFATGGAPRADGGSEFLPLRAEGRIAWWFGRDLAWSSGVLPFVFVHGGLARTDANVDVSVRESSDCSQNAGYCPVFDNHGNAIQLNPQVQTVSVWRPSGSLFVGGGGGVMFKLAQSHALVAEVRAAILAPTSGFSVSPSIGYAHGL